MIRNKTECRKGEDWKQVDDFPSSLRRGKSIAVPCSKCQGVTEVKGHAYLCPFFAAPFPRGIINKLFLHRSQPPLWPRPIDSFDAAPSYCSINTAPFAVRFLKWKLIRRFPKILSLIVDSKKMHSFQVQKNDR